MPTTKEQVVKVWIAPGCIVCDACENTCPPVFDVTEDTCLIRPEAMEAEFTRPITDLIIQASKECPVDVIKYEVQPFELTDEQIKAAEARCAAIAAETGASPAASHAPAAEPPPDAPAAPAPTPASHAPARHAPATPARDVDPVLRKSLESGTSRGGIAGRERSGLTPAAEYKGAPASKLPPEARFMRMMDAAKSGKADEPSRRDMVLVGAWGSFAAAMALGTYAAGVRYMFPNVLNEPEKRIRVGLMDKFREMPPGGVNEEFKPQGIWIVRVEDRIAALSTTCTHLGCIPSWLEADRKFKCPCHGSGFKQEGINFEGPAPRPLERFKVGVEDGVLVVDKGRKFQYEKGEWENPESFITV